ncbi:MAG: hypothetical protein AABX47_02600 [Nanoarchaeota archaeon]
MKSLSLCVIVFVLLTLFSTPVAEAVQGRTYTSKDANQNLNSNQPFQGQASEPITAQHPSGNTVNVPQGSDIANQNGDFSASQSSGATTPGGVSIGPATDLTSKQNGDLEAKTANTVKTPTSQANKVTDLKVSQDGKRFSTAQAEQIQAKTASKITKTKNAINYRQTVDDIEIEESDGFDSAPATQGSSQPYLSSDNADNIHQYQDGTITMDRADELRLSSQDPRQSPSSRPFLSMQRGSQIKLDPQGELTAKSFQSLTLYQQSNTPALQSKNGKNLKIKVPGLSPSIELNQRQPLPFSPNKLLETILKLSNLDLQLQEAEELTYQGIRNTNPKYLTNDLRNKVYHIQQADEISIGNFKATNIKDATILINSETKIFQPDAAELNITLDGRPIKLTTTSRDNILQLEPPKALTQPPQKRTITIQGITLEFPLTNNISDIIESSNQTTLTITPENGLECAKIQPVGAYTYKTANIKQVYTIAITRNPHKICLKRTQAQSFPGCDECTTADYTQNKITSQGTQEYKRYHSIGQRLSSFTTQTRIDPHLAAQSEMQLDKNLEQINKLTITSRQHNYNLNPDNFFTITDKTSDQPRRYLKLQPTNTEPSDNIIDQLITIPFPPAYQTPKQWMQTTKDGQPRIRIVEPGNPLQESLLKDRQDRIKQTTVIG